MRILLIAPDCYPVDGAESIVNIKLLQALSKFDDIEVDLVSRKHRVTNYPSGDISQYGVKVNELFIVESHNKLNLKTFWQTIMCFLVFGCSYRGSVWAYESLPVVNKLLKKYKYDFILTKSSPSFLLGSYCHQRGLKWVASWNDPYPESFYPFPYGDGVDHKPSFLEHLMLRRMKMADYHIFPSSRLMNHMALYLHFNKDRAKVIPHSVVRQQKRNTTKSEILHIIHSGNLSGARNPNTFFIAVDAILRDFPQVNIDVTCLGNIIEPYKPNVDRYPYLIKKFTYIPPIEYTKALQLLKQYSIACIIEAPCKEGEAVFLPTKVTDFMQEGIPIMAISPKGGVLNDLYNKGNIGYFADVMSVESIKEIILRVWDDFKSSEIKQNVVDTIFTPESIAQSYRDIAKVL